jgi:hypothetical protein
MQPRSPRLEDLFDDEALRRVLRHQSVELGLRPATGVVSTFGPHLELQGAETDLNIFQLTTEQLAAPPQHRGRLVGAELLDPAADGP